MPRIRLLTLVTAALLLVCGQAQAHATTFSPDQPLDLPIGGPPAAAVGAGGAAVVAGVRVDDSGSQVLFASRPSAGAPWTVAPIGRIAQTDRDVQAIVKGARQVVAWAEVRDRGRTQSIVVATGAAGGPLVISRRIPVGDAFAASPRLARLHDTVILAWRDKTSGSRSRVRVATVGRDHDVSAPRTIGSDVADLALTSRGSGAAVGWSSAYKTRPGTHPGSRNRSLPRTMTVATLDSKGRPTHAPVIVARDVAATVRLAGSTGTRLIASWLRPQGSGKPGSQLGFTRQVLPRLRPARPLTTPDTIGLGAPTVAFDGNDRAVGVVRAGAIGGVPSYEALAADSIAGGPWSRVHSVAALDFTALDPIVAFPAPGDAVVAYSALVPIAGTPGWTVAVADATGAHDLGVTNGADGQALTLATAPARTLIAWTTTTGVQVVDRH